MNEPKFQELAKVLVKFPSDEEPCTGYVVKLEWRDSRWIYQISLPDEEIPDGSWDNWAPEEWLSAAG
ncbi:hypothetical protein JIN84_18060 [Luteolibacter yonseiensis]|uniref:Uncharacterized protein n=1 Tax=Luteolibacter yonseiensis TaxID=1144680 RepID=A0A934R7B7_9BACT|nr:hypothetical protein [Luteolibacter yonseiensis]MBK1817531.1 hypothetical protein [Luteolibacter yonseiensis]